MSLVLMYHDQKRAVCVSDDLATWAAGPFAHSIATKRHSKFRVLPGGFIIAALGHAGVGNRVFKQLAGTTFRDLDAALRLMLPQLWATRSSLPAGTDHFSCALVGFDFSQQRMRCLWYRSLRKFEPREAKARVSGDGFWDDSDAPLVQALNDRMATSKDPGWIAAELAKGLREIGRRHPGYIGQPGFFAALDAGGMIALPDEFPPVEMEEKQCHQA